MSKIRFELNTAGVRELLQSGEMQGIIADAANMIASNASDMSGGLEYNAEVKMGANRVAATVRPGSIHAYHKTRKENILEKAKRSVKV